MTDQDEKAALRAYIERKLPQARREQQIGFLIGSLITAATMSLVAWSLTFSGAISETPWVGTMLLSIALFVSVLLHTLSVVFDSKLGEASLRRNLAMRYRFEKALYGTDVDALFEEEAEKPKRERYRLTDDGEIVPEDDAEDDAQARRARSG